MLILVVIAQLRHPRNNIINIINIPNINNIRLKLRNIHKHIDFKHGTAPTAEISPRSLHFGRVPGLKSMYLCMFRYFPLFKPNMSNMNNICINIVNIANINIIIIIKYYHHYYYQYYE